MPRNPNLNRRGLAMLLVLVGLMIGTILATAYLASRDNSAAIGENIASAARARWAAASALELGIAVMQTETSWRTKQPNGKLLDDYTLAGAIVDLDIIDLETGGPTTAGSSHFELTATATTGGIEQTATAVAYVPRGKANSVAVDLSEFAIFATGKIELTNQATLTRWPTAPLSAVGRRIVIGTNATAAGSIQIKDAAAAIDTTIYHGPAASGSLVLNSGGPPIEQVELRDLIPVPAPPDSGVALPSEQSPYPKAHMSGGVYTVTSDLRWDSAHLENGALVIIPGTFTLTTDQDRRLESNSKMLVDGHLTLVVFDDLLLNHASIELTPGATLTIYVRDRLEVDDSYIGDERADNSRDNTGDASWMDPQRIRIFSMAPASGRKWELKHNSVVKASIYAPTERFEITDDSALYGRVTAKRVEVKNNGAIFYDHGLAGSGGYSDPDSPIYDTDGDLKDALGLLTSLDPEVLAALSDALGLEVLAGGKSITGDTVVKLPPEPPLPGEPTPRPVPVEYEIVSFGTDMTEWERK